MRGAVGPLVREAQLADLDAINRVVESAVMSWSLPERVKRLSLPSYRYNALDLEHLELVVAEDHSGQILGVAAWEDADPRDLPEDGPALLLHGLYVQPADQHRGLGRQLFSQAEQAARQRACRGLLVKAQAEASDFFSRLGMEKLAADNPRYQYANRYWKPLGD